MSEVNKEGFHVSQIFFLTPKVDHMAIWWEFT